MSTRPVRTLGSKLPPTHLVAFLLALGVAGSAYANGPSPISLGTAGNFAILAKTGISTVPPATVKGNIGVSPIASTAMTGFSLVEDATNAFWISDQITGKAFGADNASPTSSNLTTAVLDMEGAYTDGMGRSGPDFNELATGNIGGLTLAPGLYKWTTGITIPGDVTISGGQNDVWIFQTTGNLSMASVQHVILAGGAQAKNIYWVVAGNVALGTGSHFEGILLCKTDVSLLTRATMNGRILAQTAAVLQMATVIEPSL